MKRIILVAVAAMSLASCSTVSTQLATQTPVQVTTLAAAIQATTLVDQVTDTYVKTGNPSVAELKQIQTLSTTVHTQLQALEVAQAAGQSLAFTAFDTALIALQQYEASLTAVPAASAT